MGRKSIKEDKNIYHEARDALDWSREKAAEEIAKIDNGKYFYLDKNKLAKIELDPTTKIQPEDVVGLSKAYNKPELRNYYCCHQCDIGRLDAPEVIYKDNVYEMLVNMEVSLNLVNTNKNRLMEILSDGKVDDSELTDLNNILDSLEKISMTVEAIQLWCEKTKNIIKEKSK